MRKSTFERRDTRHLRRVLCITYIWLIEEFFEALRLDVDWFYEGALPWQSSSLSWWPHSQLPRCSDKMGLRVIGWKLKQGWWSGKQWSDLCKNPSLHGHHGSINHIWFMNKCLQEMKVKRTWFIFNDKVDWISHGLPSPTVFSSSCFYRTNWGSQTLDLPAATKKFNVANPVKLIYFWYHFSFQILFWLLALERFECPDR